MEFWFKRRSPFVHNSLVYNTIGELLLEYKYMEYFDTFVFRETYYKTGILKRLDNNIYDGLFVDIFRLDYPHPPIRKTSFIERKFLTRHQFYQYIDMPNHYIRIRTEGLDNPIEVYDHCITTTSFHNIYKNDYSSLTPIHKPINLLLRKTNSMIETVDEDTGKTANTIRLWRV